MGGKVGLGCKGKKFKLEGDGIESWLSFKIFATLISDWTWKDFRPTENFNTNNRIMISGFLKIKSNIS